MRAPWLLTIAFALALVLLPAGASAQSAEGRRPSRDETIRTIRLFADSLTLPAPYVRERFTYPRHLRPDPVMPPPAIATKEESLPEIFLSAILFDTENPARSVAIVRAGEKAARPTRVIAGQRIGEIEILRIAPKFIVIGARKLGKLDTDTLHLGKRTP